MHRSGKTKSVPEFVDRMAATMTLDAPNVSLIEYKAPANYPASILNRHGGGQEGVKADR